MRDLLKFHSSPPDTEHRLHDRSSVVFACAEPGQAEKAQKLHVPKVKWGSLEDCFAGLVGDGHSDNKPS